MNAMHEILNRAAMQDEIGTHLSEIRERQIFDGANGEREAPILFALESVLRICDNLLEENARLRTRLDSLEQLQAVRAGGIRMKPAARLVVQEIGG